MTVLFAHDNDVSDLFVGKRIGRGEVFYQEGVKGNATGNHCHIECSKGKFTGTGWHKNRIGYWSINNSKKPEECLWLDDTIQILDNHNYVFKKIQKQEEKEKPPEEEKKESTEIVEKTFISPKTDLYGVYLKENQKLIILK